MFPFRHLPVIGIFAAIAVALPAAMDQSIAVSSTAVADYVRPADPAGGPRPETYVFAEGKFFGGGTVDGGLDRTTFADITRTLALNLAKQNYFPAGNAATADLLIMVHWGTTIIYEDPQRQFTLEAAQAASAAFSAAQEAGGMADPSALNFELGAMATARAGVEDAVRRNAILLGYARVLDRERRALQPTAIETTMVNELNEERYFIIVMAYDNKVRTKDHKSKLLWVTRLSVRSPGNNFVEALPTLAQVGADVYGRQLDDLVRVKTRLGTVKLHELEILGPAESTPPTPRTK